MKKYEVVLFDLDGTLTDPGIGITNSVAYALKKFEIEITDRAKLYKFIGPPLLESFQKLYNLSKEEAKTAVDYYRDYYRDKGIFENSIYNGIEDLLKCLRDNRKTIIVATSKPEIFAKLILEHFDIDKYFTYIAGGNLDGTRTKKDEVIEYALNTNKIFDKSTVVMIGDRDHDIFGAKKIGIDSIGVLFGYGSREELESAQATYIAENIKDIETIIFAK
jgi:phosphoglycolate phosphatase